MDAADYDKRTAIHIAASEGNLAATKILVGFGASIDAKDRWNNTACDDAIRVKAGKLVDYFDLMRMK